MGWFDDTGAELRLDPNVLAGNTGFTGGFTAKTDPSSITGGFQTNTAPAQQGQFANTNQGFLDWATQQYGADPNRGSGFVNAQAGGGLQNMLQQYQQSTGNTANYQAGPSGDRVDWRMPSR